MSREALEREIKELQRELEEKQKALATIPDKWEPKGGEYYVSLNGSVCWSNTASSCRIFGVEYTTREQAEKASKAMRAHNRLLAYVAEFAPDYEFKEGDRNWYVYYDFEVNMWDSYFNNDAKLIGVVYMPDNVAEELVEKLNSGEVVL